MPPTLASYGSPSVDDFTAYFTDKLNSVRQATAGAPPPVIDVSIDVDQLSTFEPVTGNYQIRRLLGAVPTSIDPAPTWLIKRLADVICRLIVTCAIAMSLSWSEEANTSLF